MEQSSGTEKVGLESWKSTFWSNQLSDCFGLLTTLFGFLCLCLGFLQSGFSHRSCCSFDLSGSHHAHEQGVFQERHLESLAASEAVQLDHVAQGEAAILPGLRSPSSWPAAEAEFHVASHLLALQKPLVDGDHTGVGHRQEPQMRPLQQPQEHSMNVRAMPRGLPVAATFFSSASGSPLTR